MLRSVVEYTDLHFQRIAEKGEQHIEYFLCYLYKFLFYDFKVSVNVLFVRISMYDVSL